MKKLLHCYIVTLLRKNSSVVCRNALQRFSNRRIQQSNNGFTLIELIIVIAVISILSVIVLTAVDPIAQFHKANDARRKSDLGQIQKILEQYYQDVGRYPQYDDSSYQIKNFEGSSVAWGTPWPPFIGVLPKDPASDKRYVYFASDNGQWYRIYASLDREGKDPQACNGGAVCFGVPTGELSPCGGVCNYGVSSPNVSP